MDSAAGTGALVGSVVGDFVGDRVGLVVVAETGPDALDFEGARLGKSLIKFVGGDVFFVDDEGA